MVADDFWEDYPGKKNDQGDENDQEHEHSCRGKPGKESGDGQPDDQHDDDHVDQQVQDHDGGAQLARISEVIADFPVFHRIGDSCFLSSGKDGVPGCGGADQGGEAQQEEDNPQGPFRMGEQTGIGLQGREGCLGHAVRGVARRASGVNVRRRGFIQKGKSSSPPSVGKSGSSATGGLNSVFAGFPRGPHPGCRGCPGVSSRRRRFR